MDLSIVIPVYNEEKNVPLLYNKIKRSLNKYSYQTIFVDDGSTDSTPENLQKLQKENRNLKIIHFPQNKGLSKALETGFSKANGKIVVSLDGDMQNSPEDIPRLVEKLSEGYDVVCGWRCKRKDALLTKRIPSKLFNLILKLLFNTPVHDNSCTLRAYKSEAVKNMKLDNGMHRFIPVMLHKKGCEVAEIKVAHTSRIYGKAKYDSPKRFWEVIKSITKLVKHSLCSSHTLPC